MRRVPEVIDVWFDSGAMPFAQHHAPFENQELFEARYPADYICEAIDQTRGWFYSLIAISTLLFDRSPYRTVLVLGHIADAEGKKMSKSLGNIVPPWEVLERHGADAFRWYYLTSKQPWDGYLFSVDAVGESLRQFLLQLWNTYGFYVMYANVNGVARDVAAEPANDLDRWALSRLAATVETVGERLDAYDATRAGHALAAFVDDLSNWYVRRSRRRFWDGDEAAFATLRHLPGHGLAAARAVLPVHGRRDLRQPRRRRAERAPHGLARGRRARRRARATRWRSCARRSGSASPRAGSPSSRSASRCAPPWSSRRARSARRSSGSPTSRWRSSTSRSCATSRRPTSSAPTRSSRTTARSARASASRCRRWRPPSRRSTPSTSPRALRDGGRVGISVDGHDHELDADDLMLAMQPLEGYQLEREGSHAVALELELDDELRREGLAREIVHAVQSARKAAGLQVEDRIELTLGGDEELLAAARAFEDYLARETLAVAVTFDGATGSDATIAGHPLAIAVTRVER